MPNSVLKFISKKEPTDRELEFRKMERRGSATAARRMRRMHELRY